MEREIPNISFTEPDGRHSDPKFSASEEHQKLPKRTILTLLVYGLTQLFGGLTNAILSPFYTKEAADKGIAVWQTGLVKNKP